MLVAVAGIILASIMPGGELGSDSEKDRITQEKMEKIEAATRGFMAANLRRPCPADGTLAVGSANFGKEDANPGRCSGTNFYTQSVPVVKTGATTTSTSAIATTLSDTTGLSISMLVTNANLASDTHIASVDSASQITLDKYPVAPASTLTFTSVAAGVVPTRTLGLPDDYMFDAYGRRIGYMVDIRSTDKTTCRNMQTTKTAGAIRIMDSAAATYTTDNVMWSLISYGKNGHGAFPMQGSSIANRINSGATNDDERINAFVATGTTSFATAFTQKLIKHEPVATSGTTYFDDIIWTQETTKNTCCTGKICMMGTRVDGTTTGVEYLGTNLVVGDINGDAIPDMVFYKPATSKIRVVFGKATGWPPSAGTYIGTPNSSRLITLTNDSGHTNFAGSVAVGDINGDGYSDIAIGYGDGTSSNIKIFYGSASPVSTNISTITDVITFPVATGNSAPSIVLGNFANTGGKDILALVKTASGAGNSTAYVIYGAGSYSLTAEAVTTVAATVGFKINTSTGRLEAVSGTGDVNNDGYDDILLSNYTNNNLYVLFGQSAANWDADKTTAAVGSTPDIVDIDTRVAAGGTESVKFTNGGSNIGRYTLAVADINGDGTYKDIIFNNGNYFYVYYGKTAASWASPDLSAAGSYDGTDGFRFDVVTTKPAWLSSPMTKAMVADVNNDGKTDVIFTDNAAGANSAANSGSTFVALQPSAGWSSAWTGGTLTLFAQAFDAAGTGLPLNNDVSKGYRIDGYAAGDASNLLGIADINNDGKNDLLIGAPARTSNAGSVYILFGRTLVPWDTSTSLGILN